MSNKLKLIWQTYIVPVTLTTCQTDINSDEITITATVTCVKVFLYVYLLSFLLIVIENHV